MMLLQRVLADSGDQGCSVFLSAGQDVLMEKQCTVTKEMNEMWLCKHFASH